MECRFSSGHRVAYCGVLDKAGTVEKGKWADLIVVAEPPLDNISNLRKLKMVLRDGHMVNLEPLEPQEGMASFWRLFLLEDG